MDFDNILDNNKSIEKTNQKSSELHLYHDKKPLNKDNSKIVSIRNGKVYIKNKEEHNNPEKSTPDIQAVSLKNSNKENTLKADYSIHVPSPTTGSIEEKNVNTLDQGKNVLNNTVELNKLEGNKTLQKDAKSNEFVGLEKISKNAARINQKNEYKNSNSLQMEHTINLELPEISKNVKVSLEPFAQTYWDSLPITEKKKAITNLIENISHDLSITDKPAIRYHKSDEIGSRDGYSKSENTIYIDEKNINNASNIVNSVAHETRHCWQYEYSGKSASPEAIALKENFDNYIKPDEDLIGYKNQIIEKDARQYASEVCNNIPENLKKSFSPSFKADIEQGKTISTILEQTKNFEMVKIQQNLIAKLDLPKEIEYIITADVPLDAYNEIINNKINRDKRFSNEGAMREALKLYFSIPDKYRTNINVINSPEAILHGPFSYEYRINTGYLPIAWPNLLGLDISKPIQGIFNPDGSCNIPSVLCRRGAPTGSNLTFPKEDGSIPSINELAIPYEDNPKAIHYYNIDTKMYKKTIDIIANLDESNISDLQNKTNELNKIIDDMNIIHSKITHLKPQTVASIKKSYDIFQKKSRDVLELRNIINNLNTTYGISGTVAPMYKENDINNKKLYNGGAAQFNTPIPIYMLIKLGVIWENNKVV